MISANYALAYTILASVGLIGGLLSLALQFILYRKTRSILQKPPGSLSSEDFELVAAGSVFPRFSTILVIAICLSGAVAGAFDLLMNWE